MKELECNVCDWSEILTWYGIDVNHDNQVNVKNIKERFDFIFYNLDDHGIAKNDETELEVEQLRKYVKCFSKHDQSTKKVWSALADLDDDYTFVCFLKSLIEHLWI